jgi:hypothetical protein
MTSDDSDEDLSRLVTDLVRTLRELESELEPPSPEDGPRLPTPRDLRRLTSEVAIPGLILVLETNIRALRLLQRALRLAEGADTAREETSRIQEQARSVSETTLERLDDALVDLRDAVEGRPNEAEAAELLDQARDLRAEVQERLREAGRENGAVPDSGETQSDPTGDSEATDDGPETDGDQVDVDAELRTIKSELEDIDDEIDDDRTAGDEADDDTDGNDVDDGSSAGGDSTDDGNGAP